MALAVTVFAGCIEDVAPPAGHEELPVPMVWMTPELPKVSTKVTLENHAEFVKEFPSRANNVPTHLGARDALEAEFQAAGYEVWRQKFRAGIDQENICAVKIGVGAPTEWVVVGGHYDTTTWDTLVVQGPSPPGARVSEGAYDDGSGTRITVEIAKAFATIDTYYSVIFCAFDGEERNLQGSKAVYDAMKDETFPYLVTETRGMLDFDMFGICWPVRAPIFFDQNNQLLHDEVQKIRKEMGIPDDMFKATNLKLLGVQELGSSDYGHWHKAGIPTAFFISDFIELGVPVPVEGVPTPATPAGAYPWWHWQDTVESMTAMAGGPDMLEKGFQTALDLGVQTFALLALRPDLELVKPEAA